MAINIGLIDYGIGNLYSVEQSFKRLDQSLKIVSKPKQFDSCDALILPGVGAFKNAMSALKKLNIDIAIKEAVLSGSYIIGICLGFQLLFEESESIITQASVKSSLI